MVIKESIKSFLSHIGLFLVVEIVFVLIVFREFPETDLYTKVGIAHLIYRAIVFICAFWRERAKKVIMRSLALWTPMVTHVLIHVWIGVETVHEHSDHGEHHDEELIWLILGTLVAGVLVYFGEKYLHKTKHCDTHHHKAHEECLEGDHGDCEGDH